jgi:hypothetical protein
MKKPLASENLVSDPDDIKILSQGNIFLGILNSEITESRLKKILLCPSGRCRQADIYFVLSPLHSNKKSMT